MEDEYIEYDSDDEMVTFDSDNKSEVFKQAICECPVCKKKGSEGLIFEGSKSFYCNNARSEYPTCEFVLYKNNIEKLIRRDITADEVIDLCENGSFIATCTKINDDTKTYEGIFSLKPMGKCFGLKLSFPD